MCTHSTLTANTCDPLGRVSVPGVAGEEGRERPEGESELEGERC